MLADSKLYKETLIRVGKEEMIGINRLINDRHYGIAERHTVGKLLEYVRSLEKRLGINMPNVDAINIEKNFMKINANGVTYHQVR